MQSKPAEFSFTLKDGAFEKLTEQDKMREESKKMWEGVAEEVINFFEQYAFSKGINAGNVAVASTGDTQVNNDSHSRIGYVTDDSGFGEFDPDDLEDKIKIKFTTP